MTSLHPLDKLQILLSECTCGKVEQQKMVWDLFRGCNCVKIDNLDHKTTIIVQNMIRIINLSPSGLSKQIHMFLSYQFTKCQGNAVSISELRFIQFILTFLHNLSCRFCWIQSFMYSIKYKTLNTVAIFAVSGLTEHCPIFHFPPPPPFVRPSQAWHINFSRYFDCLYHENHIFSECISSRLVVLATLTTWTTQTTWTTWVTLITWINWTT